MKFLQFKNPKYDDENVIQKIRFPIVTVIVIDIVQYNYAMSACLSLMRDRDHLYLQLIRIQQGDKITEISLVSWISCIFPLNFVDKIIKFLQYKNLNMIMKILLKN